MVKHLTSLLDLTVDRMAIVRFIFLNSQITSDTLLETFVVTLNKFSSRFSFDKPESEGKLLQLEKRYIG